VKQYLETTVEKANKEQEHKWELRLGIGVGAGVPVLMALTALNAFMVKKKRISHQKYAGPAK